MLVSVFEVLEQLAKMAALQATAMLAQQSFGAIEEIRLEEISEQPDESGPFYRIRWASFTMGLPEHEVNMVVLPEFLAGGLEDLEYFQEQLTAYIVERVLELQTNPAE